MDGRYVLPMKRKMLANGSISVPMFRYMNTSFCIVERGGWSRDPGFW